MSTVSTSEDIAKKVGSFISKGVEDNILKSNKPINAIGSMFGLAEFGNRVFTNPENFSNIGEIVSDAAKKTWTDADGALRMGKIAGSYIGAASAYRVLSGGGIYRDKNGNADLIGIPFI